MAKKKKYRRSNGQYIILAAIAVAMLAGAFGLGWHFGVKSTEYHGNILLVNENHRLDANYVPDELVNLYQRQQEVYASSEPGKAQQPGASEHQTGLAFDVTVETNDGFESTPQYSWLMQHAHEYGFIQRYPANKADITGISYEPWHYRYVGVEAATRMYKTGQTLEEYMGER